MKYLTIIVAFLAFFSSCTKDVEETTVKTTADYLGKWTLVKTSGSIPNYEATGTAMEWQEFYLFKNDGTFIKSRVRNGVKTTASGTYTTQNYPEGMCLKLTYSKDNELIGNCFSNLIEGLCFKSNNTLSSDWSACDGPRLEYQKVD